MRILGIMGSPRIEGNTDILLDEALKGAHSRGADVEKIIVDRLNIAPCREYYGCYEDGSCVIRDAMDDIYVSLSSADAVIVASPMFFYGLTSQLKALIDRCQAIWARRYVLHKETAIATRNGAFIAVGATRGEKLFDGSILTVKYFFKTIDINYTHELLIRGVDKKGEIREQPQALADAYELGRRLANR